ncbi:hypothetical protein ACT7DH_00195 [Bacillus pacificus]
MDRDKDTRRTMQQNNGYELLQGSTTVQGRLIGGCIEYWNLVKERSFGPGEKHWEDSILFFETSEDHPEPSYIKYWLRNYAAARYSPKSQGYHFW